MDLTMYKSVVYKGDDLIGEVDIYPQNQNQNQKLYKELRISHMSQPSERCPPLAVLHTITACGVCFKMESPKSQSQDSPLFLLHASCLRENKTAVVSLGSGSEELHFVAMYSKKNEKQYPCFWAFNVALGLYDSCLVMLNLRCLGIVFDLDETLVVANTMRSFDDRIESLNRKINTEVDPQRISGMLAEVKRYQDDKAILKQYAENDQVVENGKVVKTQSEVVPALGDTHQPIIRPIIRLQESNIILTRINPLIRDTSVLVRLRPAWEELRNYLTAKGRKRFEVYVCTMAEKDYALEMWRLLDPDLKLINPKEFLDRIVCVKSGLKKSLFNVFQDGSCHPKMALVIDDRLKVWDENDQPRVHVVPAFAPYYAPQAEANNTIPVLCVARNVACNVRGGFFKEFDDCLLPRISEVSYDDNIKDIMSTPDVSNYLVSEDETSAPNVVKDAPFPDGMADAEVERRLKDTISASLSIPLTVTNNTQFPHSTSPLQPPVQVGPTKPSLQNSPAREEGEVPESELDPDTRRRLLILQHGQDNSEPPTFSVRPPPMQVPAPQADSFLHENNYFPKEGYHRDDRLRFTQPLPTFSSYPGDEAPLGQLNTGNRNMDFKLGRGAPFSETPVGCLLDIAMKCGTKVEFMPLLVDSVQLRFAMEVWFSGEKVGEGTGRTRREAQYLAAENALKNIASRYLAQVKPDLNFMPGNGNRYQNANENGFINDLNSFGYQSSLHKEESLSFPKRQGSPRSSFQGMPNKRLKPEFPHALQQRIPSARYPNNGPFMS